MSTTYKIGEAAALLNLKTYVLRFWETEFPDIVPLRTEKGQRMYTPDHLALLERIRFLLHERGLTIEGARKLLAEEKAQGRVYSFNPHSPQHWEAAPAHPGGSFVPPAEPADRPGSGQDASGRGEKAGAHAGGQHAFAQGEAGPHAASPQPGQATPGSKHYGPDTPEPGMPGQGKCGLPAGRAAAPDTAVLIVESVSGAGLAGVAVAGMHQAPAAAGGSAALLRPDPEPAELFTPLYPGPQTGAADTPFPIAATAARQARAASAAWPEQAAAGETSPFSPAPKDTGSRSMPSRSLPEASQKNAENSAPADGRSPDGAGTSGSARPPDREALPDSADAADLDDELDPFVREALARRTRPVQELARVLFAAETSAAEPDQCNLPGLEGFGPSARPEQETDQPPRACAADPHAGPALPGADVSPAGSSVWPGPGEHVLPARPVPAPDGFSGPWPGPVSADRGRAEGSVLPPGQDGTTPALLAIRRSGLLPFQAGGYGVAGTAGHADPSADRFTGPQTDPFGRQDEISVPPLPGADTRGMVPLFSVRAIPAGPEGTTFPGSGPGSGPDELPGPARTGGAFAGSAAAPQGGENFLDAGYSAAAGGTAADPAPPVPQQTCFGPDPDRPAAAAASDPPACENGQHRAVSGTDAAPAVSGGKRPRIFSAQVRCSRPEIARASPEGTAVPAGTVPEAAAPGSDPVCPDAARPDAPAAVLHSPASGRERAAVLREAVSELEALARWLREPL